MTTARVLDFTLDDVNEVRLRLLVQDIEHFHPGVTEITLPRDTLVKLLYVAINSLHEKKKLVLS